MLEQLARSCRTHSWFERYYGTLKKQLTAVSGWKTTSKTAAALSVFRDDFSDSSRPRVFALDCEMVLCRPKDLAPSSTPGKSTLARVSLVECKSYGTRERKIEFTTVLDVYTQIGKDLEVVDYLTYVSGIEKHHLERDDCLTFVEAQKKVLENVDEKDIILSHSLWSDFSALQVWHENFIDTAFFFTLKHFPTLCLSLKDLVVEAHERSGGSNEGIEDFQKLGDAHDSVADAKHTADVVFRLLEANLFGQGKAFPVELVNLPDRLLARISINNIASGITDEQLREAFFEMKYLRDLEAKK